MSSVTITSGLVLMCIAAVMAVLTHRFNRALRRLGSTPIGYGVETAIFVLGAAFVYAGLIL